MANFLINELLSVFTNSADAPAFNNDSAGADNLTVNADSFLVAIGADSEGARLANTLAWKVTVNGIVYSEQSDGINLLAGNSALSTITIGADGDVGGFGATGGGIRAQSAVTITNAGSVTGETFGIRLQQTATVTNTGTIAGLGSGAVGVNVVGGGTRTLTNSGTISGDDASYRDFNGLADDKVTNSGTMNGRVVLFFGNNSLTNSGTINGAVVAATGNDILVNSGTINDIVSLGDGTNVITNSGTIGVNPAVFSVAAGAGNDTLTNTKLIVGSVALNDGVNKLTNSGTITGFVRMGEQDDTFANTGTIATLAGDGILGLGNGNNKFSNSKLIDVTEVQFGDGNDTVTNTGTIDAIVDLGGGTNSFTNSGFVNDGVRGGAGIDTVKNTGTVSGVFDLEGGNDSFTGGNAAETLRDADGSDIYKFGNGNDTYLARRTGAGPDGTDSVDGGAGVDTYDARNAPAALAINLDTVDHDLALIGASGFGSVAKNTGTGANVDGGGGTKDTLLNFENATAGDGNDFIYGSAAANTLDGDGGDDHIVGFAGNDTLIGGDGADVLVGGAGRDTLTGLVDGDADKFVFVALSDSTVGKAGRDRITGFEDGDDVIVVEAIDAVAGSPSDEAFTYVNVNSSTNPTAFFTGTAGELRSIITATGWTVQGDVNGDRKADFAIDIDDADHSITLTSADFFL